MSEVSAGPAAAAAAAAVKDVAHPVVGTPDNAETINGHVNGAAAKAGDLEMLCRDLERQVDGFLNRRIDDNNVLRSTQEQVRVARGVIDEALRRYRPEELSLSYNGGKDCLVLLILILASLPSHFPPSTSTSDPSPGDTTTTTTSTSTTSSQPPSSTPELSSTKATPTPTTTATTTTPPPPPSSSSPSFPTSFQALYIRPPSPFPEVDDFVAETTARYHLDLATSDKPMKAALTEYLSSSSEGGKEQEPRGRGRGRGRGVRAVFVGTRRTDPHGALLTHFDETDRDWPRFMRVHPVIDWHYREVWGFIRALDIPYCPLYDKGYTSLGGTDDTHPNPALLLRSNNSSGSGEEKGAEKSGEGGENGSGKADRRFRPAYELMEDEEERLGRDR
ncbi:3'-phosphoadenosine 5'-phosphosulfate sulfotransferase [Diatrype stigma]|uniref:FAD synthase n=1 Tax=Diatrype stigma TaxID=117547 RepID=A0AAN9UN33_9PEZI